MNEQDTASNPYRLINESAGGAYLNRMHQLSFSQNVFRMNALELVDAVQRVEDPDQGFSLMLEKNREAGRQSHREVNRRLHNFVSSALTLVEHTRIFMRTNYDGTDVLAAYEKQVAETFVPSPIAQFVQGLRNYILHRGLPNSSMYMSFQSTAGAADGSGTMKTGVQYPKASLLDWDKWNATARSYLEGVEKHVDILDCARSYQEIVEQFHSWLRGTLELHHREDLEELERLQVRLHALNRPSKSPPVQGKTAPRNDVDGPAGLSSARIAELDQHASHLLTKIREVGVRQPPRGFETEIPMVSISEDEIIGTATGWFQGADSKQAFVFIRHSGKPYGISEDDYEGVEKLVDLVLQSNWARTTLSREFVETEFFDWARQKYISEGSSFSKALSDAAEKAVTKVELWAPIAHTVIEKGFEFGPVRIETIGAAVIAKFRNCGRTSSAEQEQKADQLFERLKRELQGYAAVVVSMNAEPICAGKLGRQMAQDAVGLLRFFAPAAPSAMFLNTAALRGEDFIPKSQLITYGDGRISVTEGLLTSQLGFWRMSEQELAKLKADLLDAAASLVLTEGLSEFSLSVRSSLLAYSRGTTLANPMDRLQCALTAVEGVLLKHDMEARAHNVAGRMSMLLADEPDGRQMVRQKVQQIYWLREQPQLSAEGRRAEDLLSHFAAFAHSVLHTALGNISNFRSKAEFVTGIDRIDQAHR